MRIRNTFVSALTGMALAWGGLAVAQQTAQPNQQNLEQQRLHQQQQQRDHQQLQAQRDHKQMQGKQGKLMLKKADQVIGTKVVNKQGVDLGEIHELAIDGETGQVAYAVLEFTKLTDIPNKLFAVPWKALQVKGDDGKTPEQQQLARDRWEAGKEDETWFIENGVAGAKEFVLDVTEEQLENAPGFDRENWPDMANRQFGTEVHRYYNQKPYWETEGTQGRRGQMQPGQTDRETAQRDLNAQQPGAQVGQQGQQGQQAQAGQQGKKMILKADEQLIGQNLTNQQGEDIGEVHNLMIDRHTGKIAFVVLQLDQVEGDRNMAALPWNQISWKWNEQEQEGSVALNTSIDQLRPHLFAEDSWPNLNNQQFASNLYRQFDARPFWETGVGQDVLGFEEPEAREDKQHQQNQQHLQQQKEQQLQHGQQQER